MKQIFLLLGILAIAGVYASQDSEGDLAAIEDVMWAPGEKDNSISFEDALLSVPVQSPEFNWLQTQWGALRHQVLEPEDSDLDLQPAVDGKAPNDKDLENEYKRIYALFYTARKHFLDGLKMRKLHVAAFRKAQNQLKRMRRWYNKLKARFAGLTKFEHQKRLENQRNLVALRKDVENHRKRSVLAENAAGAASKLVEAQKAKMEAEEKRLKDFVRKTLQEQRKRQEEGLAAMDAKQRRTLRRYVREKIQRDKENIEREATLAEQGKLVASRAAANSAQRARDVAAQQAKEAASTTAAPAAPTNATPSIRSVSGAKPPRKVLARVPGTTATKAPEVPKVPTTLNTKDSAFDDCSNLSADDESGYYWIKSKSNNNEPQINFCSMRFGGGWTYVAEKGRNPFDLKDVSVVLPGGYGRQIYDLSGKNFHEVLVRRTSRYWCDSWGRRTASRWSAGKRSASMGISVDNKFFDYHNAELHSFVKQPISDLINWADFRKKNGVMPWKATGIAKSDMTLLQQTKTGSTVRIIPASYQNNYLEIENIDGLLGNFGGCDIDGSMKIQVFVRPYNKEREEARLAAIRRRAKTNLRRAGSNVDVCCGVTSPNQWQPYGQHMFVDINTAHCGFKKTPQYFSTQSGDSSHWTSTGSNSHYGPTKNFVRVYTTSLYAWRFRFNYRIRWCGFGQRAVKPRKSIGTCCGRAPTSGWKLYSSAGHMWQDVDLKPCGFAANPQVFTSVSGLGGQWTLRGVEATYFNSKNGFRSYVYGSTPTLAQDRQYVLDWCAVGVTEKRYKNGARLLAADGSVKTNKGRICCGSEVPKWENYSNNGITGQLDTSKCRFSDKVTYFTSIGGSSHHWASTGANAIYSSTPNSFRTYIHATMWWTARVEHARAFAYKISWCGIDPTPQ